MISRTHHDPRHRRHVASPGVAGFDRLIGKGIYYGAARSEAGATHGLDVHLIGAGNSAGQAALYFANHARAVTLVVRGESLENSMSRYLIEQLAVDSRMSRSCPDSEVQRGHGDTHLDGDRHPRQHEQRRCGDVTAAAFSSSSAPTRRPVGCRPRSLATIAAMS